LCELPPDIRGLDRLNEIRGEASNLKSTQIVWTLIAPSDAAGVQRAGAFLERDCVSFDENINALNERS
jgi:hypothetical protein